LDVDVRIRNETALHRAVEQGHAECCRVLLEAGADPEIRTLDSKTALQIAASWGVEEVVYQLVFYGADLDAKSHDLPSCRTAMDTKLSVRAGVERARQDRNEIDSVVKESIEVAVGNQMPKELADLLSQFLCVKCL
jgi:ankyrin repeat protein